MFTDCSGSKFSDCFPDRNGLARNGGNRHGTESAGESADGTAIEEETVKKRIITLATATGLIVALALPALATTDNRDDNGPHGRTVVYVTSQGQFYDSVVLGDLPQEGPFQKLEMGINGLQTEFGPGDPGYLGGRWWLDANGNGIQDEGDAFFLCPLLGPGDAAA
jgi:hypothetical protein